MPPKQKIPAPIDRPLSRAYLREFSGWSTAYPPGLSEPTSLRTMENTMVNRDGSLRIRPGMRYLSYDIAPFSSGDSDPLEGLVLRGVADYNGLASAALPAGSQVGDLVVVAAGGGNYNGGKQKPYLTVGHGANPDPRLTGYVLHEGGEQFWGTLTDLTALPLPSLDQGAYGDTGYTKAGGVWPGTAHVVVAVYGDATGQALTATLHSTATRSELTPWLNEGVTITSPATDGPVVALVMDARGYSYNGYDPPGYTIAVQGYVMGIDHKAAVAPVASTVWVQDNTYQVYDQTLTVLNVQAVVGTAEVDIAGVAFDRPFVGTHEAFYLDDGAKAYLCAVREVDETVGFRAMVLGVDGSTMFDLTHEDIDFEIEQPLSVLNFSADTTYVKYLQIDNKIFALSDNGEPMRIFTVGEHKAAKALAEIERPEWDTDDKLIVVHPDASWITGRNPTSTRRNRILNPSFERNLLAWSKGDLTQKRRPANPAVTPVSGARVMRLASLPTRTNLATAPLHAVATLGIPGWSAGGGGDTVAVDGAYLKVVMPATKGRYFARSWLLPGVKAGVKYQVAYDTDDGANVDPKCIVRFYGINNAQVGSKVEHEVTSGVTRWASPAMKAPKGAVSARIQVGGESTVAGATSTKLKNVVFCPADETTGIFTGSSGADYFWTGTVNASASVYHPAVAIEVTSKKVPARPGKAHSGSLYVRAGSTIRSATLDVRLYNKNSTLLTTLTSGAVPDATATWTRLDAGSAAIGALAVKADLKLSIPSVARGEYHYVDAAMFEAMVSVPGVYFDGSTADVPTSRYSWLGKRHASRSLQEVYAAGADHPVAETRTVDTLVGLGGPTVNDYSFGFFYTFDNEVGESAASKITVRRAQRAWSHWAWETANAAGEPSGTDTNKARLCADQLVASMPQDVFDEAMAQGATSWSLYMLSWSNQDAAPVTAVKVATRKLSSASLYGSHGWIRVTPSQANVTDEAPLPTKNNRINYSDPSRGGQGLVAADRMILVNDPTEAAVIRWSSNRVGEYTNFTANKGGGYKTLTSGNLFVPAAVKLWQNPQSTDTLCVLCLGTDGHSTSYYMAPAQVASQSDATNIMGFEETTATPGTTSPYGVEIFNNALYHPLDDQLMKSTASNYNINHKSMTDLIANMWQKLATKYWIMSSLHDNRLYYLVNNPDGAPLEANCKGNEVWVFDAATENGTWSRFLIQAHSLRKLEFGTRIYMSVIRPDGVYYLDPEYSSDDYVGAALAVNQRSIGWAIETNTQGANRAHDAWAHLQQVALTVGNFIGTLRFGVRGYDVNGKAVDVSKLTKDSNALPEDGLPFDLEDFLLVRRDMKEWRLYAESVLDSGDTVMPSAGQLSLVQYRYAPVSVNVGYEYGSIETFEYKRNAAVGNTTLSTNGVPNPMTDIRRP